MQSCFDSFIFGIYERQNTEKKEDIRQYVYRDKYAWDKQFGDNEQKVFENVKRLVNEVIKNAQNGNFAAIDVIPLYGIYINGRLLSCIKTRKI